MPYSLTTTSKILAGAANHLSKHAKPNSTRSQIGTQELRTQGGAVYVDMIEQERLERKAVSALVEAKTAELKLIKSRLDDEKQAYEDAETKQDQAERKRYAAITEAKAKVVAAQLQAATKHAEFAAQAVIAEDAASKALEAADQSRLEADTMYKDGLGNIHLAENSCRDDIAAAEIAFHEEVEAIHAAIMRVG